MDKTICAVAVLGLILSNMAAGMENPYQYTASPEKRAELLAKVRSRDKERAAAKAKGPAVVIVENGQPKATIVCAENADLAKGGFGERNAATELQQWVKRMSGVELPISATPAVQGVNIYVGQAAVEQGLKLSDIKSLSSEGIRVRCDGKNIFIAGQSGPATFRAVARFLEEEFGCRWFADMEWGMVYPKETTLKVLKGEFTETPGSIYRRIWGPEGAFGNARWKYWNGDGGVNIPMAHSWGFLDAKKDFAEHPEWFRLDENGQRVAGHWYNIGHPEVRKRFMEWAIKASDGGKNGVSFSPPDDHREDFSPESKKYDNPDVIDPSSGRVSMTDRFMGIVNPAAKELYKLNPNPISGFYAYSDYTLPPTNPELNKLSPNLCIWIAPIRFSRFHPLGHPNSKSCQELKVIVDGWAERASMIGWRTYNYNLAEVITPFSKLTVWANDLPYLYTKGCVGVSLESFNVWELSAPHLYQSIRLGYDPRLDPWEIVADYWDKFYGPAADPMEKYWMEIDQTFCNLATEVGSIHSLPYVYTPERMKKLEAWILEAEKIVKNQPEYQYRVNLARRGFQRATFWRTYYDALNRGDFPTLKATYEAWVAFVEESLKKKHTNKYSMSYLSRFTGNNFRRIANAVTPKDAPPNKIIAVLPDEWKTATKDEITQSGVKGNPSDVAFNDAEWKAIRTFTDTRNAQGFPEYFGEMWYRVNFKAPASGKDLLMHFVKADRKVTLYINGKRVNEPVNGQGLEAFGGCTIDVTDHIQPGKDHQITVMVEHIPLPELFLGGLVSPVYLIEKGK